MTCKGPSETDPEGDSFFLVYISLAAREAQVALRVRQGQVCGEDSVDAAPAVPAEEPGERGSRMGPRGASSFRRGREDLRVGKQTVA